MWSFVGNQKNKQWIWLVLGIETKEIVSVYVGERSRNGAMLRAAYGNRYLDYIDSAIAVCYTEFWVAYDQIFPQSRHRAVGKNSGKTNLIESFNYILRQGVSRLPRKTLSFSKKLEKHIGAIWYFIHHHNELLRF